MLCLIGRGGSNEFYYYRVTLLAPITNPLLSTDLLLEVIGSYDNDSF